MNIKIVFFALYALLSILQSAEKPNIVVILADDLGFSDIGCYGSEIKTPYLDQLANKGLRFTQFYNTSRCWPTRAALMTGYYAQQIGRDFVEDIKGDKSYERPEWAKLIPAYLKDAGYRSYHSGKWHIDSMPIKTGFDRSYFLNDQRRFFSPKEHYEDDKQLPEVKAGSGYYNSVEIADRLIKYLKQHEAEHKEKPFFAYAAFPAPHFPLHALPEDIEAVGNRYDIGWDQVRLDRWQSMQNLGIASGKLPGPEKVLGPSFRIKKNIQKVFGKGEVNKLFKWSQLSNEQKKFQSKKMAIHAAMIERMDKEIGRIIAQIKSMKQFENTMIVFLSDNGASAEVLSRGDGHDKNASAGSAKTHLCLGPGWANTSNTPFRKFKKWVHEGGSCTPFIVHWPQGINSKNELRKDPAHVIDVVPTILEMAGIKLEKKVPFPGESLLSSFAKDTGEERSLWWSHEGNNAYRKGPWKIVQTKGQKWELFNIEKDRTESNNLAQSHPEIVKNLSELWLKKVEEFRKLGPHKKLPLQK